MMGLGPLQEETRALLPACVLPLLLSVSLFLPLVFSLSRFPGYVRTQQNLQAKPEGSPQHQTPNLLTLILDFKPLKL